MSAEARITKAGEEIFVREGISPERSIFKFPGQGPVYIEMPGSDVEYSIGTPPGIVATEPEARTAPLGSAIRLKQRADALYTFNKTGRVLVRLPGRDVVYTVTGIVGTESIRRLASDSLETVLQGSRDVVIEIDPTIPQTIRSAILVGGDNVTVRSADPSKKATIIIPAPRDQYWGLVIRGKNFLAENLKFTTAYSGTDRRGCPATPFTFAGGGQGEIRGCSADNVDAFVVCQQDHAGVHVTGCETSARTRGQGVWGGGDNVVVENCTLRSRNEHPIRFGDDSLSTYRASNVVIRNCRLLQTAGAKKECLSIRKGDGPFLVEDVVCQVGDSSGQAVAVGYGLRLGYESDEHQQPLRRVTLRNVRLINCWLDCKGGNPKSDIVFDAVTFEGTMNVKPPLQIHGNIPGLVVSRCLLNGAPLR